MERPSGGGPSAAGPSGGRPSEAALAAKRGSVPLIRVQAPAEVAAAPELLLYCRRRQQDQQRRGSVGTGGAEEEAAAAAQVQGEAAATVNFEIGCMSDGACNSAQGTRRRRGSLSGAVPALS